MVKKKSRLTKKLKKRGSWTDEDVQVHTGLPPMVEGQLRCYLKLSINQILWLIPVSPELTSVKVLWWGEDGDGAIFRPVDVKKGSKGYCRTTGRYAIRSGPKQLASYLNEIANKNSKFGNKFLNYLFNDPKPLYIDMNSLILEVLSGPMMVAVGRVQVDSIGLLSPSRPINGFFPVFSAAAEKVAELQVSIVLESLMAVHWDKMQKTPSYDSMSSIPTTDMSVDVHARAHDTRPEQPPKLHPMTGPSILYSSLDDPFSSPAAIRNVNHSPRGIDGHLYGGNPMRDSQQSQTSGHTSSSHPRATDTTSHSHHETSHPTTSYPHSGPTSTDNPPAPYPGLESDGTLKGLSTLESQIASGGSKHGSPRADHVTDRDRPPIGHYSAAHQDSGGSGYGHNPPGDLVSVLLERGDKLRKAMIVSTLEKKAVSDKVENTRLTTDIFSPLRSDVPPEGRFLKELLREGDLSGTELKPGLVSLADSEAFDMEGTAVDLVLGNSLTNKDFKLLKKMTGSSESSVSELDEDLHSDQGDPLHDEELLQDLFYKSLQDDSDEIPSGVLSKARRTRSNCSLGSLEDHGNRRPASRASSASSVGSDRRPTRDRSTSKKPSTSSRNSTPSHTPKKHSTGSKNDVKSAKKKKKKKRRKGSRSDASDSETLNASRISEISKVSFDPAPSDHEHSRAARATREAPLDGISVERLTLLGRVHVARMTIDCLALTEDYATQPATPRSAKSKVNDKPPRPARKTENCTYFVEYQFPVVATSRDKYQPNAMATEVMRAASKKISDRVVAFNHRSVFPVLFDGDSIEKWWKSALVIKIYSKPSGHKTPKLLGMASIALKSILKSEALYVNKVLEVKDRSGTMSDISCNMSRTQTKWPVVGDLKVTIELASDSRDFSTALAKTRLAEMLNPKIIPIPQPRPKMQKAVLERLAQGHDDLHATLTSTGGTNTLSVAATQTEPRSTDIDDMPFVLPPDPRPRYNTSVSTQPRRPVPDHSAQDERLPDNYESLTLHTILLVPEGLNISMEGTKSLRHTQKNPALPPKPITTWTGRDMSTRNTYLVCRMFWCDDVTRSEVSWGTTEPQYNFVQVAPVLLTGSLLERMRNNFMVIEVWDKKTSSHNDQLVGIVKLPLHQFYMSYRDRRVAGSLLRSQYPVVSVDSEMPVINPISGMEYGRLKVLLAMGSSEQVNGLQRLKLDSGSAVAIPERPSHYLERNQVYSEPHLRQDYQNVDNLVEHVFEVSVEAIKGLKLLDNMIWGEADCFVQYHFPTQTQTAQQGAPNIMNVTPSLKAYRTATTLCVPDPVFNDVMRHKLVLAEGTPVQREILTACSGAGGGVGGVPFEVWCRYYYPNVRDQVIAKATLPLAKLCAMVTMHKRGEHNVQTFSLPIRALLSEAVQSNPESEAKVADTGLLDITVNYKTHTIKGEPEVNPKVGMRSLPGATVCISLGIIRASGLKVGALALARLDSAMQYPAEVGVNSYIRVRLSFLQKEDERFTRTVARSFAPEFNCYMDFPCPLLWTDPDTDALSLAEILDRAEAMFEVWHQVPGTTMDLDKQFVSTGSGEVTGRRLVPLSGDVLLGTVTVPLTYLLRRKTGLNGWFPINLPSVGWDTQREQSTNVHHGNRGLERVVGGLELSLKFAHHEDLERVVHAARGVGWAPDFDIEHRDWESADEMLDRLHQVEIAVELAVFPLQNALTTGQTKLDPKTSAYLRYKFYDKGAVCSRLASLELNEEDYLETKLGHRKTLVIQGSSPFTWYLREEMLELQLWVTHHDDRDKKRPRHRDKLIGSAYIDLVSLADTRRRQHRVSGVYPLFKPGAASLGGACLRAHVSLKPHTSGVIDESEESDLAYSPGKETERRDKTPVARRKKKEMEEKKEETFKVDMETTFPVHISIEQALHLPWVMEKGESVTPSAYVSYPTAESADPVCTDIVADTESPYWNHVHNTRLSKELWTQTNKHLLFKVWHKPKDISPNPDKSGDKVLGFVSVDLAPLTSGFKNVCGWYNIMDFNGQCQGQIKISVTPESAQIGMVTDGASAATDEIGGLAFHGCFATMPAGGSSVVGEQPALAATFPLRHFEEHFHSVKRHHKQLHDKMQELGVADPNAASRSILFTNLRTNIQELDEITSRLKERLSLPSGQKEDQRTRDHTSQASLSSNYQQQPIDAAHLSNINLAATDAPITATISLAPWATVNQSEAATSVYTYGNVTHKPSPGLRPNRDSTENAPPQRIFSTEETGDNTYPSRPLTDPHSEGNTYDEALLKAQNLLQSVQGAFSDSLPSYTDRQTNTQEVTDDHMLDDDDTLASEWAGRKTDVFDDGEIASDISDIEPADSTVVVPKALNDVSSANFSNALQEVLSNHGNANVPGPTQGWADSWLTNSSAGHSQDVEQILVSNEDSDVDKLDHDNEPSKGKLDSQKQTHNEYRSNVSDSFHMDKLKMPSLVNEQGTKTYSNGGGILDEQSISSNGDLENEHNLEDNQEISQRTLPVAQDGEAAFLSQEDPTLLTRVSRTSANQVKSTKIKSGRKAAMFRREYMRHRGRESSSSDEEDHDKVVPGARSHHKSWSANNMPSEAGNTRQLGGEVFHTEHLENQDPHSDPDIMNETPASTSTYVSSEDERQKSVMEEFEEFKQQQADGTSRQQQQQESSEDQTTAAAAPPSEYYRKPVDLDEVREPVRRLDLIEDSQPEEPAATNSEVPNFFLPPRDLEATMRALRTTTLQNPRSDYKGDHVDVDPEVLREKASVAKEYMDKLPSAPAAAVSVPTSTTATRTLPSAEQTQRIAKIFAQRFSS